MKVDKKGVKVERCAEMVCPFYHAGIMGSLHCMAAGRDFDVDSDRPPDWCPLRAGVIKVRM